MIQCLQKNTDRLIMKWNHVLLTVIALFTVTIVNAQFYPVQTTTQLIPPYSVYLSDYATGGNEKLRVILLQRDLTQPSYQLRLVMTVELNGQVIMRTSRAYNPAPINLNPGIPTVISGAELAPYVDSRNIDFVGYSRDQYERTKALPEGSYQITFTAYDYRRQDVQVSNAGISFYYLSKNEPPLINFPACGTKVPMRTPQQIVFSWLSRNTASPNSAADTEFELSLYETRPEGRNPNDVVLSTQPVFRITVDLPQYIYSPSDPLLLNGMKYVWRVRAIDRNGKDAFRNNGYSEVCTFTYGGSDPDFDMGVVKNLQAEGETERKGRIWWDLGDYDGYVANYRKTGEGYEWFTSTITKEELAQAGKTQGEVKLFDLEPDTEYETRVQPKKSGFLGAYTDIIKFRTKPHVIAQCGVNPNLPQADLTRPMRSGIKGMLIQVDDIEIQLMDVLHLGDGWYKGTGRTSIPYFGGAVFAVTFDRLYIDENRVAGLGRIDFVTQGVAGLVEQQNANLVITKKDLVQKENREEWKDVNFFENIFVYDDIVITNVTADASGEISIVDNSGNATPNDAIKEILKTNPDKAIIIQDKNGDQYVVQKDGANTKVTKVEGGGLAPGADGKMLDEKTIKNLYKMILISLNKYQLAISQYKVAANPPNGKGGGDRVHDWRFLKYLANLPVCLEGYKDQLDNIATKIATLADSAQVASHDFASHITPDITVVTQDKVDEVVCKALVEGFSETIADLKMTLSFDKNPATYLPILNDSLRATVSVNHIADDLEVRFVLIQSDDIAFADGTKTDKTKILKSISTTSTLLSKSYASVATLKAILFQKGIKLDSAQLQIPIDTDKDQIADVWEMDPVNGGSLSLGKNNQKDRDWDDDTSRGNKNDGDNYTKWDEYQGVIINSVHRRLKPTRKEVFFDVTNAAEGAFVMQEFVTQLDVDVTDVGNAFGKRFPLGNTNVITVITLADKTVKAVGNDGIYFSNGVATAHGPDLLFGSTTGVFGTNTPPVPYSIIYAQTMQNIWTNNSIPESMTTTAKFDIQTSSGFVSYYAIFDGTDLNGDGDNIDQINHFDLLSPQRAAFKSNTKADNDPIDGLIATISRQQKQRNTSLHEAGHGVGIVPSNAVHPTTGVSVMRSGIGPAQSSTFSSSEIKQMKLK